MRLFQQEIKKRIAPYMKRHGFRLRNRTFSYISSDIACCVSFEQPGSLMYTWVHVNPLYIPQECFYLSYGNRLNNIAKVKLPPLSDQSTSADLEHWCDMFIRCMDSHILPFFRQVDSPDKLLAYVEKSGRKTIDGMIGAAPWLIAKLKMYTYLYLGNLQEARAAISAWRKALEDVPLTASLQETLRQNMEELELLIAQGDDAVRVFCEQTICSTAQLFAKSG